MPTTEKPFVPPGIATQKNRSASCTWQYLLEEMIRLLIAEVLNMLFQVLKGPGPLVGVSNYEVNICR
jgi:hypothetical protein